MRWIILIAYFYYTTQVFSQFPVSNYNSDIARIVLELEKEIKQAINIENYLQKIDSLAELIQCELDTCNSIKDTIAIINYVFFYRQHLVFQDKCEFFSDIFDKQCGNCASFSALYLAITSRLGIKNLYPILAPNHVFVRYDFNGKKINIETTQKGDEYSNEWYRTYFGISEKYLLSDTYFRNLSQQEFIAVLINNRGNEFHRTGKPKKAIKDFNTALSMFPTLAEVYFGLAEYYQDTGDTTMAIEQYDSVIKYNPDFVNAYCNRGLLFEQTGMFDRAINDYNTALKLKPDFAEIYYTSNQTIKGRF